MPPQDLLGKLHHDVEAAGALQHGRTSDNREDGQHHADWRVAGSQPEDEDEDDQSHAGDQAEPDTAVVDPQ